MLYTGKAARAIASRRITVGRATLRVAKREHSSEYHTAPKVELLDIADLGVEILSVTFDEGDDTPEP